MQTSEVWQLLGIGLVLVNPHEAVALTRWVHDEELPLVVNCDTDVVELDDPSVGVQCGTRRCTAGTTELWVAASTGDVVRILQFKVTVRHETATSHTNHRALFAILQVGNATKWIIGSQSKLVQVMVC